MDIKTLEQVFFGNRILDYIIALVTLFLILLFAKAAIRFFIRRSLEGEQVVFSNNGLTNSRVRNYRLMEKRRVLSHTGVIY